MTMLTPERFLRAMKKTPVLLDAITQGVTQEQAQAMRDGNDGWSVLEILCHLRDFERIFFERAKLIVAEDNPQIVPVDHEPLVIENKYSEQDFATVFNELAQTRQEAIAWYEARSAEDWARTGAHPEWGTITLLEQAIQLSEHDLNHLEQIVRCLHLTERSTHAVTLLGGGGSGNAGFAPEVPLPE